MRQKLIFAILILSIVFSSELLSQNISFRAGLNIAKTINDDKDYSKEVNYLLGYNNYIFGFQTGALIDFNLINNLSLETGLLISNKGGQREYEFLRYSGDLAKYERKINLYYFEIPLALKYSVVYRKSKLFFSAGGFVSIGFEGNISINGDYSKEIYDESEDVKWGSDEDEDDIKREEFGLIFGTGVEYQKFLLGTNYSFSLNNLSPYTDNGTLLQNRVFTIYFGYRL